MSKTLSLDIRLVYQLGLVVIFLMSAAIIITAALNARALLTPIGAAPAIKIREQQLLNAIKAVIPPEPVD